MVDGNSTRLQLDFGSVFEAKGVLSYGPGKMAVEMVVKYFSFVRFGLDQQAAVGCAHSINTDAHRQDIVICVGIESPVLVPFYRRAEFPRFHI